MASGSREIARHLRQIAAGQLTYDNGLLPTSVAPVVEVEKVVAKPKAPRKSRAKKVLVSA